MRAVLSVAILMLLSPASISAFHPLSKAPISLVPFAPTSSHLSRQPLFSRIRFGTTSDTSRLRPLDARLPNGGGGNGVGGLLKEIRQQLMNLQARFSRGSWNRLLLPTILLAMLASGQFGWLWGVLNTVFLLVFIVPIVGVIAVNLWVKFSLVNGNCPNCSTKVMLPKNGQSVCFACGTPLLVEDGKIGRAGMYNTQSDAKTGRSVGVDVVDVEAIDVDSREAK